MTDTTIAFIAGFAIAAIIGAAIVIAQERYSRRRITALCDKLETAERELDALLWDGDDDDDWLDDSEAINADMLLRQAGG